MISKASGTIIVITAAWAPVVFCFLMSPALFAWL